MEKLAKVKVVLIDLSGTIHVDNHAIQGSIEAIERLKKSSIKYLFATNTTKESKQTVLAKLNKIGFKLKSESLFTSLTAASNLIKQNGLNPHLVLEEDAKKDFLDVCDINLPLSKADSLVIGLAPRKFNYKDMNEYFNFLHSDPNKKFIGINKSRYFKAKNGLCLGAGAFIKSLEWSSGKKASLVGKPNEEFFRQAVDIVEPGVSFENVAMIGDDLKDDVIGAQSFGITGILVRTGKYAKEDENREAHKPDFVFDSIVQAIDVIIAENQPKPSVLPPE